MRAAVRVVISIALFATAVPHGLATARPTDEPTHRLREIAAHEGIAGGLAFSPDGRLLATCGRDDALVRIWDVASGEPVHTLKGHSWGVSDAAFFPDGKRIASAGADHRIRIWDLESGEEVGRLRGHTKAIRSLAVHPEGRRILSGGEDGTLRLWDLDEGEERWVVSPGDAVEMVAFHPDGLRAAAMSDERLGLWSLDGGKPQGGFPRTLLASFAFTPDGLRVLWASRGNDVGLVTLAGGQEIWTEIDPGVVRLAALTPDGQLAISGGYQESVVIRDARSGKRRGMLAVPPKGIFGLAVAPSGEVLATSSADGKVQIWDLAAAVGDEEEQKLPVRLVKRLEGHEHSVFSLAFRPDGRFLASGSHDGWVRLWAVGEEPPPYEGLEIDDASMDALAWHPGGDVLAYTVRDMTVRLWNLAEEDADRTFEDREEVLSAVAFDPAGKRLATGYEKGAIVLWDLASGKIASELEAGPGYASSLIFTADGRRLVAADYWQKIQVFDLASGETVHTLEGHTRRVRDLSLTSDGELLASCSRDGVRIWSLDDGKEQRLLDTGGYSVEAVAFQPEGRLLASAGFGKSITIWDASDGEKLATVEGHEDIIFCLAFHPGGQLLASGGGKGDPAVRLWEIGDRPPPPPTKEPSPPKEKKE